MFRGRRLRVNESIRSLVRETTLSVNDFIYPVFVVEGENIKKEISSMPGNYHYSVDRLEEVVNEMMSAGFSVRLLSDVMTRLSAMREAMRAMTLRLERSRSPPQPKTSTTR